MKVKTGQPAVHSRRTTGDDDATLRERKRDRPATRGVRDFNAVMARRGAPSEQTRGRHGESSPPHEPSRRLADDAADSDHARTMWPFGAREGELNEARDSPAPDRFTAMHEVEEDADRVALGDETEELGSEDAVEESLPAVPADAVVGGNPGELVSGRVGMEVDHAALSRPEVVQNVIAKMVNDGLVTHDLDGRKVVLLDVDVPGRGEVHIRLWKKADGIELRLRADDASVASDLRQGRAALRSAAREKGIRFSRIEVLG